MSTMLAEKDRKTRTGKTVLPTCAGCTESMWNLQTVKTAIRPVGRNGRIAEQTVSEYRCANCGKKAPLAVAATLRGMEAGGS